MTKRHTWSFNPQDFNSYLVSEITDGGSLRLDLLRKVARQVAARAGDSGRIYLEMISLDDSDFLDDEWIHQDKLYAACLADRLIPAPGGSYILNVIPALRFARWAEADIRSVISGDQLKTLADSSESQAIRKAVAPRLADYRYGGWLGVDRAREVLLNLHRVADLFAEPPGQLLEEYPPDLEVLRVRGLLVEAFEEATLPLEAGVARSEAIRIVDRF
jgi:hypothetical protein